jgi:hypothetical protein
VPDKSAIYHFYTDNILLNADLSISLGTDPGDPNYTPSSLVDGNPAKPAKIDSVTAAWLAGMRGVKTPAQSLFLIHHDFKEGCDVRIQGNDTDTWGTPSFEAHVTIPAWLGSGVGRWPVNPWLDLTEQFGYDPLGWMFWRLLITSNDQNVQLGQWLLCNPIRRFEQDLAWSSKRTLNKRLIENRTSFGVSTIYSRNTNEVVIEGDHRPLAALEDELIRQWYDVEGRARSWPFVPNGLLNECFFGRWQAPSRASTYFAPGAYENRFVFEETSRGLRLGV